MRIKRYNIVLPSYILFFYKGIGVFDLSTYLNDTGLRDYTSTDNRTKTKPLHVVVTHTHFDHSGNE